MYARRLALILSAVVDADSHPVLSVTEIGGSDGGGESLHGAVRILGFTTDAREALMLVESALADFLRPNQ